MTDTTTRYCIRYEVWDLGTPGLRRSALLTGRSRGGVEEVATFATRAAAEDAASIQLSLPLVRAVEVMAYERR